MSKGFTKEDVIQNKKEAIKSLNNLLERYINDSSQKHLKKANLISYWLKDYSQLISFEEKFDPTKNIRYKRGNVVKLNFGFNIGCEYGGLHYGIVLDNNNSHNSPVLTIIPLTSSKAGKPVHNNSVDLGNEIYRLLKLKYDTISKSLNTEKNEIAATLTLLTKYTNMLYESLSEIEKCDVNSSEYHERITNARHFISATAPIRELWEQKQLHNTNEQSYLNKIGDEISQMKTGSIALVNQITTVSKMRIFDPRNLKGVLANISLSGESMEKINNKMKELYIF